MTGPWILLKTKWCREYQALENLGLLGIVAYLPRLTELRRAGFRATQPQPMFPGYIFAKPDGYALPTVMGVSGVVEFGGRIARVEEEIIAELRSRETPVGLIDLIHPGSDVKIAAGPFSGLVGTLCRLSGKERAVVLLADIARRMQVEVSARDLRLA